MGECLAENKVFISVGEPCRTGGGQSFKDLDCRFYLYPNGYNNGDAAEAPVLGGGF